MLVAAMPPSSEYSVRLRGRLSLLVELSLSGVHDTPPPVSGKILAEAI
jgi:hypothetical protein